MTQIRTDIAVVGAGVAGLAAACALSGAGFKVVLVHRGPAPVRDAYKVPVGPFDRRVYAISPESAGLLADVGAWDALAAGRLAPVYDMRVYPRAGLGVGDADELHLSAWEAHADALAWIIEQDNLQHALSVSLPKKVREVTAGLDGIDWTDDGRAVIARLDDGSRVRASLLVGADGASSAVRAHAGMPRVGGAYDHHAIVAHLLTARGHRDTAWQWFGEHGVLALLPLADSALDAAHTAGAFAAAAGGAGPFVSEGTHGRAVSLVWSTGPDRAGALLADGAEALSRSVQAVVGDLLGEMRVIGEPAAFPLARRWVPDPVAERLVLVGDAAHQMHPLAGQGLNVGLGDVGDLAAVLGQARASFAGSGFDPGQPLLLRRYRRRRAEPVAAMLTVTDGLKALFGPRAAGVPGLPLRLLRDAGWRAFARQGLLRRQVLRYTTRQP